MWFFSFPWKNSSSPSNTFHSWVSASNSTISSQARHQTPETDSCYTRLLEYQTSLTEFFKGKYLVRFRGAWWTTVHRDEKSWTWLSEHSELLLTHTHTHTLRLWTVASQTPLSMGFSRQEEWLAIFFRGSSWPRDGTHLSCVSCHWQAGSLPLAPPAGCYNYYSKKMQNHPQVEHSAQSSLLSFLTCKFSLETFGIFIFCRFQLHYLNQFKKF